MCANNSVERSDHVGVAIIDRSDLGIDLSLLKVCLGVVPRRRGLIESRLRHNLPCNEIRLPFEVGLGLLQRCLCTGLGRLRLIELQFVSFRFDREQRRPLLHERAVLVVDRLQRPLDACHEIDGFDGGSVAGRRKISCHCALHREADINLGRGRRNKTILFAGG